MQATKQQFTVGETFGLKGVSLKVSGYAPDHAHQAFVPPVDENYEARPEVLSTILAWWEEEQCPLYLWGPMGSGKTSGLMQMAARLNIPVQLVNCHSRLETPELVGRYVLNDEGGMDFVDGPLATAMRHGHLLILDEVDLLDPGTAAGLNGLREGMPLTVPETGEVIRAKEGFALAVTANTNGHGDEFGVYPGTNRLNQAFLDGFIGMEVGYPDPKVEQKLLQKVLVAEDGTELDPRVAERMVQVANMIRSAFIGNPEGNSDTAIEITMSTRSLLKWGKWRMIMANAPDPFMTALERSMLWHASAETKHFCRGIVERVFG